jgi:hypothetical protein
MLILGLPSRLMCVLLFTAILTTGCKKSDDSNNNGPGLSNHPTAKPEYDNNAGGIYKGIVTGSAGHVFIYFKNSTSLVYAILQFDSIRDSLICPALNGYIPPGPDINNAIFTSAIGTKDTIFFSVKGNGTNPIIKVKIPGHNVQSTALKETSTQELKVYKGDGRDTLVAGQFTCGSTIINTIGTVRKFEITIMVQGGIAILLPGRFSTPCANNDVPSVIAVQVGQNNTIEWEEGPPKKLYKFTVTDSAVFGTGIHLRPIGPLNSTDAYNTNVQAIRVN